MISQKGCISEKLLRARDRGEFISYSEWETEADSAEWESLKTRARTMVAGIVGSVEPGTVPKTSSGKIRRAAAKELYLRQQLDRPRRALRRQITRLWLAGVGGRLMRLIRVAREYLYAAWWWTVLVICVAAGAVAVLALPRRKWRWAVVRSLARAALVPMGVPLSVKGVERLPKQHGVVVFNHASYVDAIVVAAVLPGEPAYLVKRELSSQLFAGPLLRRVCTHIEY